MIKPNLIFVIFVSVLLLFIIISILFTNSFFKYINIKNIIHKLKEIYYEQLYNSIAFDYYNLSLIYNNNYNTIKIKHKLNKNKNLPVCVFGILVNDRGIEYEKSMLKWLLPEYDVYCVYQKYPGKLFEYPALRFAQWLSIEYNISIILYIHTKGASHPHIDQYYTRILWKHEFTKPKNKIYINLLKNNSADISLPFRLDYYTWYNSMFISNRAFQLINMIEANSTNRFYYEDFFKNSINDSNNVRLKGVLNDSITSKQVYFSLYKYINELNSITIKNNKKIIIKLIILIISLFFFIYLKILNSFN